MIFENEPNSGVKHLETPWLFNIKRDPKEETDVAMEDGWVRGPMRKMMMAFNETLTQHKPIPPGVADSYNPAKTAQLTNSINLS